MKIKNSLLSLLLALILLTSCGPNISHEKALSYYVQVTNVMDSTSMSVNNCIHKVGKFAKIALQSPGMKLDSDYIDTMNNLYQIADKALNEGLKSISSIEEIDQQIGLKEKTYVRIKNNQMLMDSAMPPVIKLLGTGLGKLTNEQRSQFERFQTKSNELLAEESEFQKLFSDFESKYSITDEEVKKENGVK